MLASTVQFSRYGRNKAPRHRVRGDPAPSRSEVPQAVLITSTAPAPSGPNSVLIQPPMPGSPFRSTRETPGSVLAATAPQQLDE